MARREPEGPPWGATVDPDEMYLRGQAGQAGSGLLGGWSQAAYGGAFDERESRGPRRATERDVRQTVAALVKQQAPKLRPTGG